MTDMTNKEKVSRLKLYKNSKTYTYIKDKVTDRFYNGFIKNISEDEKTILFKDDIIVLPIPMMIEDIEKILPSKKNWEIKK